MDFGKLTVNAWDPAWTVIREPKYIWQWDFLGDGAFVLKLLVEVSPWKRFITKLIFRSKWTRL